MAYKVSLVKRGCSWSIRYSVDGKQIRETLGPNEEFARLRAAEVQLDLERRRAGLVVPVRERRVTLGERVKSFMAKLPAVSSLGTIRRYGVMAAHFLEFFGADHADLSSDDIRRYINHRLQSAGARSRTVNAEVVFIKSVYGGLGRHPFTDIKKIPVRDSKEVRFLTHEQIGALLAACDEHPSRVWYDLKDYIHASLYLGVRLGELFSLKWQDFQNGMTAVRVTNWKTHGRRSGDTYRIVPVHPELAAILERRRSSGCEVPFPARSKEHSYRIAIIRAARHAGLGSGVTPHTFRHTFASHLIQNGVSLYEVSKLLGHSSLVTTQMYAHLCGETLRGAVLKLDYAAISTSAQTSAQQPMQPTHATQVLPGQSAGA